MAQLNNTFNPDEVESDNYEPIPPGTYAVIIEKTDYAETQSGNGHYIKLDLAVCDGTFKNRKIYDYLVIDHPNQEVVNIAKRKLRDYCITCDIPRLSDTEQLYGRMLNVEVIIKPPEGQYGSSNAVRRVIVPTEKRKAVSKPDVGDVMPDGQKVDTDKTPDDEIPF